MRRILRAGAFLAMMASGSLAGECPNRGDLDAMSRAIREAPTCRAAASIAQDCAFGASGDVALNAAVTEVCEKDFLSGLNRRQRATYDRQRAACRRRYAREAGTMYRSFEAFCEAGVSQRYSAAALAKRPGR